MKKLFSLLAIATVMTACGEKNPFLAEWDTPYGIPPYDEIEIEDYIPAIKAGIEQQNAQIEEITSNPDAPTFENTIVPLELSGEILDKVPMVERTPDGRLYVDNPNTPFLIVRNGREDALFGNKEMIDQTLKALPAKAFQKVTAGPAAENAKTALAELQK